MGKRNYSAEAYRNVLRQSGNLSGIKFIFGDYADLPIPPSSIIYCDPPYANSSGYSIVGDFNTHDFWKWCDKKIDEGHKVFVSEYEAPEGWVCVWQKGVNSSLSKDTGSKKAVEKLFTKESHQ